MKPTIAKKYIELLESKTVELKYSEWKVIHKRLRKELPEMQLIVYGDSKFKLIPRIR